MNYEFFKTLKGKYVLVNYKSGDKDSWAKGKVMIVDPVFVVIEADKSTVAVSYVHLLSARSLAKDEIIKFKQNNRQQLEQQQEEADRSKSS